MSSSHITTVYPDQLSTTELANGTPSKSYYLKEARNRQWALQTGFGGTPFCMHVPLTNSSSDLHIKLLAPPYVRYAWPAVKASCDGAVGEVQFKVTTHDPTYGSILEVQTEGPIGVEPFSKFFFSGGQEDFGGSGKTSDADALHSWLQVASGISDTWRDFELIVTVGSGVQVHEIFLYWFRETVTP